MPWWCGEFGLPASASEPPEFDRPRVRSASGALCRLQVTWPGNADDRAPHHGWGVSTTAGQSHQHLDRRRRPRGDRVRRAHDHQPIVEAINGRRVKAIVLNAATTTTSRALPLRAAVDTPIHLHPDDRMLWDGGQMPSRPQHRAGRDAQGRRSRAAVIHTPGHSPGCCCFTRLSRRRVTGDTLCGGPGQPVVPQRRPTIIRSIRRCWRCPMPRSCTPSRRVTTIGRARARWLGTLPSCI